MQNKKVKNKYRKSWTMNLKDILYQAKQPTSVNNNVHSTGNLSTTLHKPMGGANPCVKFLYV